MKRYGGDVMKQVDGDWSRLLTKLMAGWVPESLAPAKIACMFPMHDGTQSVFSYDWTIATSEVGEVGGGEERPKGEEGKQLHPADYLLILFQVRRCGHSSSSIPPFLPVISKLSINRFHLGGVELSWKEMAWSGVDWVGLQNVEANRLGVPVGRVGAGEILRLTGYERKK
ncbi:hypothetical protein TcWFU_010215 [Taenia crassiceps]|uniref:Uncharacterized protein n=1 Tax=Taenia crassiceps TaxID=6207 RepID=A0ABR4Q6S1_9CEST